MDLDLDAIKEENIILEENRNMAKEDNDVNMKKLKKKTFDNCILYSWK